LDLNYRVKAVKYTAFRSGLYNVVIGQRTDTLQDKLKSCPDFEGTNQDGIALLRIIKVILYSFEQACHQEDELMMIKTMFYTFKQGNKMSLQRYYELFLGQVTVLYEVGISIFDEATAESITRENNRAKPNVKDYAEARERALTIQFLQGANPSHSAEYIAHLRNSHLEGNDLYPKNLTEAYHTLSCREPSPGGSATLDGG